MARERWFYSQHHQRRGPVPLNQLVESVLAQGEPRSTLIWRKGFADWTRAEDIPEVERRIAPFLARKAAEAAARVKPASASATGGPAAEARPAPAPPPPSQSIPKMLYGGIAAGVAATGFVAWLLWPSAEPQPQVLPLGDPSLDNAPAVVIPAPGSGGGGPAPAPPVAAQPTPVPTAAAPTAAPPTPAPQPTPVATPPPAPQPQAATVAPTGAQPTVGDVEQEIPKAELKTLRQVAAWAGETLELTVYNGTAFRVTEIYVTVQRFVGDDMVEDDTPILLLPPEGSVDAGVATLLNKVAPDRAKPGVNPFDTGKFAGVAGPRPEAFRCEIVSARGLPLR